MLMAQTTRTQHTPHIGATHRGRGRARQEARLRIWLRIDRMQGLRVVDRHILIAAQCNADRAVARARKVQAATLAATLKGFKDSVLTRAQGWPTPVGG